MDRKRRPRPPVLLSLGLGLVGLAAWKFLFARRSPSEPSNVQHLALQFNALAEPRTPRARALRARVDALAHAYLGHTPMEETS